MGSKQMQIHLILLASYFLLATTACSAQGPVNPDRIKATSEHAWSLFSQGNYRMAICEYTKIIEADPKNSAAFFNRGMAHAKLGESKEAGEDYEKAQEVDPFFSLDDNQLSAYLEPTVIGINNGYYGGGGVASRRLEDEVAFIKSKLSSILPTLPPDKTISASFNYLSDGSISDLKINQPSDDPKADSLVVAAINGATPFLKFESPKYGRLVPIRIFFRNNSSRYELLKRVLPGGDTLEPYMADLGRRLKRAWFLPQGKVTTETKVLFTIQYDGELSATKIVKSSGSDLYDKSCLHAIELATPFRPLTRDGKDPLNVLALFKDGTIRVEVQK